MKLTIEGTESEIKNVLQAIGSSKEHKIEDLNSTAYLSEKEPANHKPGDIWFNGNHVKKY